MADKILGSDAIPDGPKTIDQLMHQTDLTPQELAELLDVPISLITHEAYAGNLVATIVEHDIVSIKREDALAWMANRNAE